MKPLASVSSGLLGAPEDIPAGERRAAGDGAWKRVVREKSSWSAACGRACKRPPMPAARRPRRPGLSRQCACGRISHLVAMHGVCRANHGDISRCALLGTADRSGASQMQTSFMIQVERGYPQARPCHRYLNGARTFQVDSP